MKFFKTNATRIKFDNYKKFPQDTTEIGKHWMPAKKRKDKLWLSGTQMVAKAVGSCQLLLQRNAVINVNKKRNEFCNLQQSDVPLWKMFVALAVAIVWCWS